MILGFPVPYDGQISETSRTPVGISAGPIRMVTVAWVVRESESGMFPTAALSKRACFPILNRNENPGIHFRRFLNFLQFYMEISYEKSSR